MHFENLTDDEQKVLEILYSGTLPSDRLAFEIIKNKGKVPPYLGALVCIAMTTEDIELAENILSFLSSSLNEKQKNLIKGRIKVTTYKSIYLGELGIDFSVEDSLDAYYASARRTGDNMDMFLTLDDGTHPDRSRIFLDWMKANVRRRYDLRIPGLLPYEMEVYVKEIFALSPSYNRYSTWNLRISGLKSEVIPDIVFSKDYKEVSISAHPNQRKFPSYIFKFIETESITIELQSNWDVPKDWSALTKLKEIDFTGKGYLFEEFDFIDSLPKLRNLKLYDHQIQSPSVLLRKKMVPLFSRPNFKTRDGYAYGKGYYHAFVLPHKDMTSIAGALGKSILTMDEKEHFFKKITAVKKIKNLNFINKGELITLMNVNHAGLRSVVQGRLDEICENCKGAASLNEKSLLYIAGKPERNKTEIKKKLKELNISLANKATEPITHLMVCKSPKEYKDLKDKDLPLISEQALYKMFSADAPGFIEEAVSSGETHVSDNILLLIYSNEITNVNLGLEMLKNGGVPTELVEPLLVVFKSCSDSKTRGVAKKLLLRNAPADLLPLINDSQRFTKLNEKVRAQEINKKLEKIARTTSRSLAAKMALLFHGRFKKGLRYILYHFKEPCAERTLALQAMMEGTHFDFAAGLGFKNWHDKDPESATFFNMKTPAKFPIDVVEHVPLIETANFHNCKFTSLPKDVGDMKDLKKLDLSYNFLGSIPKSIEKMTQLEHLDLRVNKFKTFPSTLKRLPNLKLLDLRYNKIDHEFIPVEIDNETREALKNCEILV